MKLNKIMLYDLIQEEVKKFLLEEKFDFSGQKYKQVARVVRKPLVKKGVRGGSILSGLKKLSYNDPLRKAYRKWYSNRRKKQKKSKEKYDFSRFEKPTFTVAKIERIITRMKDFRNRKVITSEGAAMLDYLLKLLPKKQAEKAMASKGEKTANGPTVTEYPPRKLKSGGYDFSQYDKLSDKEKQGWIRGLKYNKRKGEEWNEATEALLQHLAGDEQNSEKQQTIAKIEQALKDPNQSKIWPDLRRQLAKLKKPKGAK